MNDYEFQNGMVSTGITYLPLNTLLLVVIQSAFPLVPFSRYLDLLSLTALNKYQSRDSKGHFLFTPHLGMYLVEFSLNVFTEFSEKNICHQGFEPATQPPLV